MLVEIGFWLAVVAIACLAVWAIKTALNSHYGRHDGTYGFKLPSWAGVTEGVHRGKYEEKPEWRKKPRRPSRFRCEDGALIWEGTVTLPPAVSPGQAFLSIQSDFGVGCLPALIGESGPDEQLAEEQRIRDIVNDELASTPVYTALRYEDYGRFGDSAFDRTDTVPVCFVVEMESS